MKLSSLLFAFSAGGGAAAFLQSSNSPQLQHHLQHRESNVMVGFLTPMPSSLHMVAIRSPFGHAFDSKVEKVSNMKLAEEFIVDRDFSVATTLMAVGIWLTCFGPSK